MAPSLRPAELPAVTLPWARKGVLSVGEVLEGRAGARRLVGRREAPAELGVPGGDGDEVALDPAVRVGLGELVLAADGEGVGAGLGQLREAVVEVLGRLAHDERVGVDDASRLTMRGLGSTPSPIGWRPMCSTPPAMAMS